MVLGRVDQGAERWQIAERYRLLNAGGGSLRWKPLRNLSPGTRVSEHVGGAGYVGLGEVSGEMIPARDAIVHVDGAASIASLEAPPGLEEGRRLSPAV